MQIPVNAILNKAQTCKDGGWRLTFDVPESDRDGVLEIAKLTDQVIHLVVVTDTVNTTKDFTTEEPDGEESQS